MKIKAQCVIYWASNAHVLRTDAATILKLLQRFGATAGCNVTLPEEVIWHED